MLDDGDGQVQLAIVIEIAGRQGAGASYAGDLHGRLERPVAIAQQDE